MKILKNLGSLAFALLIAGSLQAGGHASSLKWYSVIVRGLTVGALKG